MRFLHWIWLPFIDAFRTFCRELGAGYGIGEADFDE
jgi:hypothetical protein